MNIQFSTDGGKGWNPVTPMELIRPPEEQLIRLFTLVRKEGNDLLFEGNWGKVKTTVNDSAILDSLEVGKQYQMKAPFL